MSEQFIPVVWVSKTITVSAPGVWEAVDLDTFIADLPSGVTGVALRVRNTNASNNYTYGARKNGSTDTRTHTVSASSQTNLFIGVDASHIFEVFASNTSRINGTIIGYFVDVTFLDNGTDKSTSTTGEWTDLDSGTSSAVGLLLDVISSSYSGYDFGLRKNGSTDNRLNDVVKDNGGTWLVGAAAGVSEQYIENAAIDVYLIGYVTASNFVLATNATDLSLTGTGAFEDLTVLSASAVANVIEVCSVTATDTFSLRENGDALDFYYRLNLHCSLLVDADANGVSEGKISSTDIDFFGTGYITAPPAVSGNPFYAYAQQ